MRKSNLATIAFALFLIASPFAIGQIKLHFVSSQTSQFEIGYGPDSLLPLNSGVPVFSYTDQLWIMNNYTFPVTAYLKYVINFVQYTTSSQTLNPGAISPIYTFQNFTITNWTLVVYWGSVSFNVPITYVPPSSIRPASGSTLAYFANQDLAVNFTYSEPSSYNSQVCLRASNNLSTAQLVVPPDFGTGNILITPYPANDSAQIFLNGTISKPTTFWFETYYTYTYSQAGSTGLISNLLETSKSSTIALSSAGLANLTLQNLVSLRPGRYVIRGFFGDGQNISISQTNTFLQSSNSTWIWLGGCLPAIKNSQNSFTSLSSISERPSSRPQNLYLIYDYKGVEFVQSFELNLSIAEVAFNTAPFKTSLTNIGVVITSGNSVTSYEFVGGVLYMMSPFPLNVGFNITFAGTSFASDRVAIDSPAVIPVVNIPLGEIVVKATNNGQDLPSLNATLTRGASILLSGETNQKGVVTFYVPAGNYTVFARYSGSNLSRNAATLAGENITVSLPFFISPSPAPPDYLIPLIIIMVVGIIGNAFVWTRGIRRRRSNHI